MLLAREQLSVRDIVSNGDVEWCWWMVGVEGVMLRPAESVGGMVVVAERVLWETVYATHLGLRRAMLLAHEQPPVRDIVNNGGGGEGRGVEDRQRAVPGQETSK
jgi:hypothetical protein